MPDFKYALTEKVRGMGLQQYIGGEFGSNLKIFRIKYRRLINQYGDDG